MPKQSHYVRGPALKLLCKSLCDPLTNTFGYPCRKWMEGKTAFLQMKQELPWRFTSGCHDACKDCVGRRFRINPTRTRRVRNECGGTLSPLSWTLHLYWECSWYLQEWIRWQGPHPWGGRPWERSTPRIASWPSSAPLENRQENNRGQ